MIFLSFKKSLKIAPKVLIELTKFFAYYFFGFAFAVLLVQKLASLPGESFTVMGLLMLSKAFTVLIVPYYTFKFSKGDVPNFWDFVRENIWLVVLSHIKAFFVILGFLILLIVPGVYKMIRFSFLTETVLFNPESKKDELSILRFADRTTRGYFWKVLCFLAFTSFLGGSLPFLSDFLLSPITKPLSGFIPLKSSISFLVGFYVSCFLILFKTVFYFEIKKQKDEPLSC